MQRCVGTYPYYFTEEKLTHTQTPSLLQVGTSGDTGPSALAAAANKPDTLDCIVLYPLGRVSPVQEGQMLQLGATFPNAHVVRQRAAWDAWPYVTDLTPLWNEHVCECKSLLFVTFLFAHLILHLAFFFFFSIPDWRRRHFRRLRWPMWSSSQRPQLQKQALSRHGISKASKSAMLCSSSKVNSMLTSRHTRYMNWMHFV